MKETPYPIKKMQNFSDIHKHLPGFYGNVASNILDKTGMNSNIIKIDTLSDEWSDREAVMLHACFQLLTDSVEKEGILNDPADWNHSNEHVAARKEIEDLYIWWKNRIASHNTSLDSIWAENLFNKDTEMLIRLVRVRGFLWD